MRSLRFVITGLVALAALPGFADIPRTPEGRPDMQGVWANNAATPLERPEALADKAELTAEEVARFKAKHDELFGGDGEAAFGDSVFKSIVADDQEHESYDPATGNYNHFWVVDRNIENRTSLIVDPPTGRMPALTEAAAAWAEEQTEYRKAHPSDSYTDRRLSDRCISFGVPYVAAGYNGYFHITQSAEHVAIMQEMIHDTRIIPVQQKAHVDERVSQWGGDSRGRWEGDTFVVETRNYSAKATFMQYSAEHLQLTERFRMLNADTLQWALTVDNPATWVQPWTLVINLTRSEQPIFEFACHEGNISMEGILAGARAEEARLANADARGGEE